MKLFVGLRERLSNSGKKRRKDFIEFTATQFKQLKSKKIDLPIELFHL